MAVSYKKRWKLLSDKEYEKERPLHQSRHQVRICNKDGKERPCDNRGTGKDLYSARLYDG